MEIKIINKHTLVGRRAEICHEIYLHEDRLRKYMRSHLTKLAKLIRQLEKIEKRL